MTGVTERKKRPIQKSYSRDKGQGEETFASSRILKAFEEYAAQLAAKHDKYERIVKLSRDVTIHSKRIIFAIHALMRSSNFHQDVDKIKQSFKTIEETMLKTIAQELENEDHYQYIKAYFWGLQEYIEALTFFHYISSGTLFNHDNLIENLKYQIEDDAESNESPDKVCGELEVTDAEVQEKASARKSRTLTLCPEVVDYVLGVQDLTGELMRYCINSFAANQRSAGYRACDFVRRLYSAMMLLSNVPSKEFSKKFEISRQSLEKMEMACYNRNVRGSEAGIYQGEKIFDPLSYYD